MTRGDASFGFATLRCACGSAAIMCIDPGSGPEFDPVFGIVLRRGVGARAWCRECWALLPALACERPKRPRVARHGR